MGAGDSWESDTAHTMTALAVIAGDGPEDERIIYNRLEQQGDGDVVEIFQRDTDLQVQVVSIAYDRHRPPAVHIGRSAGMHDLRLVQQVIHVRSYRLGSRDDPPDLLIGDHRKRTPRAAHGPLPPDGRCSAVRIASASPAPRPAPRGTGRPDGGRRCRGPSSGRRRRGRGSGRPRRRPCRG